MPDLCRVIRRLRSISKMSTAAVTLLSVSLFVFFSHSIYFGGWHQRERSAVVCYGDDIDEFGQLDPARKYAVFSAASVWTPQSIGLVFHLPLTVMAWKRVGFDSVVIIVGSADVWNSDNLLYHVFSSLRKLDAVVVFIKADPTEQIKISQISRIFAGSILRQLHTAGNPDSSVDDVYLVTSDADLWPISASVYDTPVDADVLSLNAFCCGSFSFNGTSYRMLPIGNIAMRISTWAEITNRKRSPICSSRDVTDLSRRTLGELVDRPICAVEPENGNSSSTGSRLDQRLVSVLLKTFMESHVGEQRIKTVKRETSSDRIVLGADRWDAEAGLVGKVDARLPLDAYNQTIWSSNVMPLIRALHGETSDAVAWSESYYQRFWQLLLEAGKEAFMADESRLNCQS